MLGKNKRAVLAAVVILSLALSGFVTNYNSSSDNFFHEESQTSNIYARNGTNSTNTGGSPTYNATLTQICWDVSDDIEIIIEMTGLNETQWVLEWEISDVNGMVDANAPSLSVNSTGQVNYTWSYPASSLTNGQRYEIMLNPADSQLSNIVPNSPFYYMIEIGCNYTSNDLSQWNISQIAGFTGSSSMGTHSSVVVDSTGQVHAVYNNQSASGLMYATYDTKWGWLEENVDGGVEPYFMSLAVDSQDNLHVAYATCLGVAQTGCNLRYGNDIPSLSSWNITQLPERYGDPNNAGYSISLVLDASDTPHIAFVDRSDCSNYNCSINYMTLNGTAWERLIVDDDRTVVPSDLQIHHGHNGTTSMTWFDDHIPGGPLVLSTLSGNQWSEQNLVLSQTQSGDLVSFPFHDSAYDLNADLHLSHYNETSRDLEYTFIDNASTTTIVIDATGDVGRENTILIDSLNNPHIVYHDTTNSALKVASLIDSAWIVSNVDNSSTFESSSAYLDSNNILHIIYYDSTNHHPMHAKKQLQNSMQPTSGFIPLSSFSFSSAIDEVNGDLHLVDFISNQLVYSRLVNGTSWESNQTILYNTTASYVIEGVVFDSSGNLIAVISDRGNQRISYVFRTLSELYSPPISEINWTYGVISTWHDEVDDIDFTENSFDIQIDSSDRIHCVYSVELAGYDTVNDQDDMDRYLQYESFELSSSGDLQNALQKRSGPDNSQVEMDAGNWGWSPKIATGTNGTAHIIHGSHYSGAIKYTVYDPYTEELAHIANLTQPHMYPNQINMAVMLDSNETVHLVYQTEDTNSGASKLNYRSYTSEDGTLAIGPTKAWPILNDNMDNTEPTYGPLVAELDRNDNIHMIYQILDPSNGPLINYSIMKDGTVHHSQTLDVDSPRDFMIDYVNMRSYLILNNGIYFAQIDIPDSSLDSDSDGFENSNDDCPMIAGTSEIDRKGCPDLDQDGYSDSGDAFPNDPSEWNDFDADGTGDNADAFPSDPNEWVDSDGDGGGDNSDAFPDDANETTDSDSDGVGNNADAFPMNANETTDSDNDGIGDNADVFPNNSNETADSDNDGLGDNEDEYPFINNFIDSDGDEIPDLFDDFINDSTQWSDYDGDGYGDYSEGNNSDAFINNASQWFDTDGDGYGDNWGNSTWNQTRLFIWPGQFVENAVLADHCPTEFGNSTADGYFGCIDTDGDGIADIYDDLIQDESEMENQSNATNEPGPVDSDGDGVEDLFDLCPNTVLDGYVDIDGCLFDNDGDGVDDLKDACPDTKPGVSVNVNGCIIQNDEPQSFIESLRSGDQGAVLQTVGIGAVLIAILGFLQTNLVAALLPDSVRWLRVLKGDSKLNKEEIRELEYLKSLVQTYYQDYEMLHEELYQLKSELTARYTNSEIKKVTREKLNTLISDLIDMEAEELNHIAHNDAFFGLGGALSTKERGEYLEQDALMRFDDNANDTEMELEPTQTLSSHPLKEVKGQINETDGHEYLEHPHGSDSWYYRNHPNGEWVKWDN
jgi:hypothetical protein